MLTDYFIKYHAEDLQEILNAIDITNHYSIYVNFVALQEDDSKLAWNILQMPRKYLKICDESIINAQKQVIDINKQQTIKPLVHTRITAVPVRENQGDFGELVVTSGITVRISQPSVIKLMKKFSCKKCEYITEVKYDWERQTFDEMKICKACQSKSIIQIPSLHGDDCADYQEAKIQEKCRNETSSSYNVGMQVILLDDLVDKCSPGDDVEISGIVIRRWTPLTGGRRADLSTIMIANSVSVLRKVVDSDYSEYDMKKIFNDYWSRYENEPLIGRDNILASICPQLFGMYTVKLALAIVLAGGVPKTNETGIRVRGEPHLLMVGDPGTGKSQVLRTAAKLAVRSVLTTGVGTTAAGLTAAAVKDTDGWHLEGGALVLADGGVCCVDEFTTMNSNDRASLHEAMEQQTISIAKAGLVSTLNSRCSVVAAINPVGGKFVHGEEMKTRLGNPLLSRFDLILLLKDRKIRAWDVMTTQHILQAACKDPDKDIKMSSNKPMDMLKSEGLWKDESLREYFSHVHSLNPKLTRDAEQILSAVFLYHRRNPNRREERTTVRLLDSLIRLAEGHARLMYKNQVDIVDAIVAAQLVGTCPNNGGGDNDDVGCPFPHDPMAHFQQQMANILELLDLRNLHPSFANSQHSTE